MKVKDLKGLRESARRGEALPTEVVLYANGGGPYQVIRPARRKSSLERVEAAPKEKERELNLTR